MLYVVYQINLEQNILHLNSLFLKNHKINKYILSNYFDEVKNGNKMNVLPNQIQKYITTINKGIDVLQREDFLDGFYNKFFYDNFSQNKQIKQN